ncbi:MAG: PQQ-dependent catabolism-associated CXXCW motif protein [Candidatus Saccharibacteria bacterium]|nr:PQQ-dependent catabolism-associated CXXCW motif protein [Pseudorhodobacter sp.]
MTRAAILAAIFCVATAAHAEDQSADYRQDNYRAPVPSTLSGATVLTSEAAHAMWKSGSAVFVDVLPRPPKPANLPKNTIWHEQPHLSIPGSIWLPNVGYGQLAGVMHTYFRTNLDAATGNNADKPLVFFCLENCWMSWNAAKRALEYGHTHVFWYPKGTDGWALQGYPTEQLEPEPGGQ